MHIDLDRLAPQTFASTVCIIGGGIAGIVLASRLAASGIDVHLLEAGGLQLEDRSQSLFATEQPADPHTGVHEGRFRTFGGSSTRWGAQLLPFTADIFAPPPGNLSRPWPIKPSELEPFYTEIQSIFHTDLHSFNATLLDELGEPAVPFSPDIRLRFSKWAPFNKRNLANTLGAEVLQHPKITVFTHANTASLEALAGEVQGATVLNYSRQQFLFTAKQFVVAAGTVESSRLLLSSPSLPNPHDQFGRSFNDHLSFHAARFTSPAREAALAKLGPFFTQGTLHTCKLEASTAARERENLLAVMAHFVVIEPEDSGTAAIRNLLRALQQGKLKQALVENLLPVFRGAGDVARLVFYARFKHRRAVSARAQLLLNIDVEQAPSPDNRIRLSERRDALGLPIAIVDWRVNPPEQQTALRFAAIIATELAALGIPPTSWDDSIAAQTLPRMLDTYHAMGGLCMGTDPTQSVVDPTLKVHGLANLHIASCAVFPSGGSSNPTFTMLALTLRLAARLKTQLAIL